MANNAETCAPIGVARAAEAVADPLKWVEAMLQLKDQCDALLNQYLGKDKSVHIVVNDVRHALRLAVRTWEDAARAPG